MDTDIIKEVILEFVNDLDKSAFSHSINNGVKSETKNGKDKTKIVLLGFLKSESLQCISRVLGITNSFTAYLQKNTSEHWCSDISIVDAHLVAIKLRNY